MIKGSTKGNSFLWLIYLLVGEIFLCNSQTQGILQVQSSFLGRAITSLGGGCSKLFVVEGKSRKVGSYYNEFNDIEGNGYSGILNPLHPVDNEEETFYPGFGSK